MIYGRINQLDKLKVIFGITNLIISIGIKFFLLLFISFILTKVTNLNHLTILYAI
jgi:hypothetical protein